MEDNKTKVAKQAKLFRQQSAERRKRLSQAAADKKNGDREETAARNYLNKASYQLAQRKKAAADDAIKKPSLDTQKTKIEKRKKAVSKNKSSIAMKTVKTLARLALSPTREINSWKSKAYNKLKEENEMDDIDAIMNKLSPDDIEKMDATQLKSALSGDEVEEVETSAEEETTEEPKSVQQDHSEKMPDNGPTPEDETAETVAQRYAMAISGLNKQFKYSTFSGNKKF